jgi:hypothetical protein
MKLVTGNLYPYIAGNRKSLRRKKQAKNAKCIPHQAIYSIGDKVLLKRGMENKYKTPYQGPCTILKING